MPFASQNLRKYAKMGEPIEIVNTSHYPVLICRSPRGVLFPCLGDVLSEGAIVIPEPVVIKPVDLFNQG
jgi:hypothetical protein